MPQIETADILLYEANRRRREKSDAWPPIRHTRHAILEHIVKNNIQNVVFLTGDIHCTNIARLEFTGTPETEMLHAYDITSSALYWPFPFADGDPNNYIHDSRASGQIDRFPIQGTGIEMTTRRGASRRRIIFAVLTSIRVHIVCRSASLTAMASPSG